MSVDLIDTNYRVGFHVSKWAPSLQRTFREFIKFPFNCFQIYLSGRSFRVPDYSNIDLLRTREMIDENHWYLCIHGCLLNNLCGSVKLHDDPKFRSKIARVKNFVTRELDLGVALNAGLVVHPGSSKDKKEGLKVIAETIVHCLTVDTPKATSLAKDMKITVDEFKKRRKIILENASGGGTKLAVTLEEIATIIKGIPEELRCQVKVCIDTAHAFGAGLYKWGESKEVDRFFDEFDKIIGLDYLELFHLNDSRCSEEKRKDAPFGSKKDVHEYLGEGYIFGPFGDNSSLKLEGLLNLLNQAYKRNIVIIGEPPGSYRDGEEGGGGFREWAFLTKILKGTDKPLVE